MNDPMAPDNYCFEGQDELDACISKLHEHAEELNELSFGDVAATIQRALYQIEHHRKEDGWTRLSRAALNYLVHRIEELPLPHVSVRHPTGDNGVLQLSIDISIPLSKDQTVDAFTQGWDPGNPFDKECPVCGRLPKQPCFGTVDPKIGVHVKRRFAEKED